MAYRTSCTRALRVLNTRLSPRYISTSAPLCRPATQQGGQSPPQEANMLRSLDRTVLCPERAETAYSGTDNAVGHDVTAYDPSTTAPETELSAFEEEIRLDGEEDPLFISPANRDYSQILDKEIDGRAIVPDKGDRLGGSGSVRGWVRKGREVKIKFRTKSGKRMVTTVKGDAGDEFERLLKGLRRLQMREEAKKE
ncbi:hypothetical protein BDV18DRAFT_160543 [Aspergillus unguis]